MDPLLVKLLQPHSARVSIRHVTLCRQSGRAESPADNGDGDSDQRQDRKEKDIYAISSVDGHVIYHVGRSGPAPGRKSK